MPGISLLISRERVIEVVAKEDTEFPLIELGEDLADLVALCSIKGGGCWIPIHTGKYRCRAIGDSRPVKDLPLFKPHRWAWLVTNHLANAPHLASSMELHRTCGLRRCCNPKHVTARSKAGRPAEAPIAQLQDTPDVRFAADVPVVVGDSTHELRESCDTSSGCWYFPGNFRVRCRASGDNRPASQLPEMPLHRWAWAVSRGYQVDPGRIVQVQHTCGHRRCCNPEHLFTTTTSGYQLSPEEVAELINPSAASIASDSVTPTDGPSPELGHLRVRGSESSEPLSNSSPSDGQENGTPTSTNEAYSPDTNATLGKCPSGATPDTWGRVFTENLDEIASFCRIEEADCWVPPSNFIARCRASGDERHVLDLPKLPLHRWVWMVTNGYARKPLPTHSTHVARTCKNSKCCNPRHLVAVSKVDRANEEDAAPLGASASQHESEECASRPDLSRGPQRLVLQDSLEHIASVCTTSSEGCWLAPTASPVACRLSTNNQDEQHLPPMAPHRWTWMVSHGYAQNPLPGKMFHVRRRCSQSRCCNPAHLYLTAPDGHELSTEAAQKWLDSGLPRWQDALGYQSATESFATTAIATSTAPWFNPTIVLEDDQESIAALCQFDSAGCWIVKKRAMFSCRAEGDERESSVLPKMSPERWAWMVAHRRTNDPLPEELLLVKQRCWKSDCCKPTHQYLTNLDGDELSLTDVERLLETDQHYCPRHPIAPRINASSESNPTEIDNQSLGSGEEIRSAESPSFEIAQPHSWIDAFPWLRSNTRARTSAWFEEPIDPEHLPTRQKRVSEIARVAVERLSRWTIGQIFPGLPHDLLLRDLDIPVRAVNALGSQDWIHTGDLVGVTVETLMDLRNVGVGTVETVLQRLANVSTSIPTPAVGFAASLGDPSVAPLRPAVLPEWLTSLADDLSCVAEWHATLGLPNQSLFTDDSPLEPPERVETARARLQEVRARDVLSEAQQNRDIAALLQESLYSLDARAVETLADRLFADEPITLDEIGRRYGLTRERIRQLEGNARGTLLSLISDGGPLASAAYSVRKVIGSIRPLEDLLNLVPALGKTIDAVRQPAWRVLDRLDDVYEIEDGWCAVPTVAAAQTATHTQLQEQADKYGVVKLENLELVSTSRPERRIELNAAWLSYCGYLVQDGFVLTRTSAVLDYAAAILSLAGMPMSVQEIVERFAYTRSANSLRNVMGNDDRFERVDRDRWALREWGMDSYQGIRTLIREYVAQNGGSAKLTDLIGYITGRYSVSASSVSAYASSPPFDSRDGIVRLAAASRRGHKTPQQTRRLFRVGNGWAYRIRITKDHLRGSGSVAPKAIASILDLEHGDTHQLESVLGQQTVAWTSIQPSFGTIRRFLVEYDIEVGTEAFLIITDDHRFEFEPARALSGDCMGDALTLVGAPPLASVEKVRAAFAHAVNLPSDTPVSSLIGIYQQRGDEDVVDLLIRTRHILESGHRPQQIQNATDVDAILDLL